MTPETIRIVSQLRREFYALFAEALDLPVYITNGNPSMANPPMASWVDSQRRLNYMRIFVHSAPDQLIPERPFIIRISVNKGGGIMPTAKWRKDCQGTNQDWHFELTLLPKELLDFLPWIVSLVEAYDQGLDFLDQEPPHPLDFPISNLLPDDAWTQKARQSAGSLVLP